VTKQFTYHKNKPARSIIEQIGKINADAVIVGLPSHYGIVANDSFTEVKESQYYVGSTLLMFLL